MSVVRGILGELEYVTQKAMAGAIGRSQLEQLEYVDPALEIAFRELYPNIQSIALIRRGGITRMLGNNQNEETFVVTDLLEGGSYLVTRGASQYRLLFTVKDGYIMVNAPLGADVVDVAQKLSKRLVSPMR
jgi:hypothetical protein